MKIILLNILLIFLSLNCEFKRELIFNSEIGSQNLKVQVLVFDLKTDKKTKELLVELNQEGKIVFSDTLTIEMNEEPMIELREINGDETDDLLIEYLRPGRGGNKVSMLYIFDESNLKLNRIPNSIFFPNLSYNENLNFISSFRFYGGNAVQMDFLKIEKDTLCSKYIITKEDEKVYIKKFKKGKWVEIGEETIDSDIIIPKIISLKPEVIIEITN